MNNLLKIGATIVFALFVAACNKADPAADFKKLTDWGAANQQTQAAFQAEFQKKVATQDPQQIEQAVSELNAKISEIEKSLNALDIQSPEIKPLKEKMKSTLALSSDLMKDSIALMKNPTEEGVKALQDKTQHAVQATNELQQLQAQLAEKYGEKK